MATDAEVIELLLKSLEEGKNELINDFGDFLDYCIEYKIYPAQSEFYLWMRKNKKPLFHDTQPTNS